MYIGEKTRLDRLPSQCISSDCAARGIVGSGKLLQPLEMPFSFIPCAPSVRTHCQLGRRSSRTQYGVAKAPDRSVILSPLIAAAIVTRMGRTVQVGVTSQPSSLHPCFASCDLSLMSVFSASSEPTSAPTAMSSCWPKPWWRITPSRSITTRLGVPRMA